MGIQRESEDNQAGISLVSITAEGQPVPCRNSLG